MFAKRLICMLSAGFVVGCSAVPARAALPDSVLVRIEGRRDIVRSFASHRWAQQHLGLPVDSITPAGVARFLDLLADEALLTEAAVRAGLPWSAADSAARVALEDRARMAVALDSVLQAASAEPLAPADSADRAGALGVRARARAIEQLKPAFDAAAIERLARAFAALPKPSPDSTLAAQVRVLERTPTLSARDSGSVLARSSVGEVRASEVVAAWARLSIAVRPRIETPGQVRDLVANQLFERVLRRAARGERVGRDPRVTGALAAYAEQVARSGYLEREVLGGITPDSLGVAAYWREHAAEWMQPRLARGIRLVLTEPSAAVRMGAALADSAQAEQLAVRAERGGAHYRFAVSERSDSILFRHAIAAGAGAVIGPVAEDASWWVARVTAIEPERQPGFAEVRDEVGDRWFAAEAERRVEALALRLRSTLRLETNPQAVARWTAELRDSTRSGATANTP